MKNNSKAYLLKLYLILLTNHGWEIINLSLKLESFLLHHITFPLSRGKKTARIAL